MPWQAAALKAVSPVGGEELDTVAFGGMEVWPPLLYIVVVFFLVTIIFGSIYLYSFIYGELISHCFLFAF